MTARERALEEALKAILDDLAGFNDGCGCCGSGEKLGETYEAKVARSALAMPRE